MKLPNGYGSVYKLSGKRRNPWVARKTIGWTYNAEKMTSFPEYAFIGYYPTRADALTALLEYNKNLYDLGIDKVTFAEVYEKWSRNHFEKVSNSNIQGYRAAYALCDKIKDMKMTDIKLDHLQLVVDKSGKNTPTLKKLKILFGLMYDYAVIHEMIPADKRNMVRYVDISQPGNPNAYNRKPFSKKDIQTVWRWKDTNDYIPVILMLIYTGVRIGELLDLKKENINMKEKWFDIIASKTESGIRKVPISDKIYPYFEFWMNKNDCEYLISTPDNERMMYTNYYNSYWKPFIDQMGIAMHRPHDTRHTCISLLTAAGVDERIIKKIVGHKGQGVTQQVYTHIEIEILRENINKI